MPVLFARRAILTWLQKTLSGKKDKPSTMRRSGILGRQADNFVTKFRLLKIEDVFIPKIFLQ